LANTLNRPDEADARERLAGDERERFLDAVMVRLGERPLLDYVRLNIVARRR
jgi:hypothetical protein